MSIEVGLGFWVFGGFGFRTIYPKGSMYPIIRSL